MTAAIVSVRRLGPMLFLVPAVLACGEGAEMRAPAAVSSAVLAPSPAVGAGRLEDRPLDEGFVVWESNRSGAWRIWIRDLAPGSRPRQLSPDESGRSHCCPHISPDGSRVTYLSLPPGGEAYLPGKNAGPLHLVTLDTGESRLLLEMAQTYFENRSVVWRDPDELIYIDGEGRTALLDVATGSSRLLTAAAAAADGWLINADLSYATYGRPAFSPYDPATRSIRERTELGGCQPYFSGDGRWGYWVAGAGGPVNRMALATGEVSTILRKNDPRLVDGFGYVYFPMFSSDARAFAFAASRGEHDHLKGDYEVFVAAADSESLDLSGTVRRITEHPATDRFPDVHLAPLPLGRHSGEAPFSVELVASADTGGWSWSFGDGQSATGATVEHRYEAPGSYRVEARRGDRALVGMVDVAPPRPPRPLKVELAEAGSEIRVFFDEPIEADEPHIALGSGTGVTSWSIDHEGLVLMVRPSEPLTRFDRLELAEIRDRAERPNRMERVTLEVAPPVWPPRRDGLLFLWETGEAPNLVFDAAAGGERATQLESVARAYLDGSYRMMLAGGLFAASAEESNRLRWALQATNELALEMTLDGAVAQTGPENAIAIFGQHGQPHNFALLERGGRLYFSLRIGPHAPDLYSEIELVELEPGRRHLVLSYSPGRLTLDVDGQRVVDSNAVQGGFFHWRSLVLSFGGRMGGGLDWSGKMEGVALYDRALTAAETRESFLRHQRLTASRAEPSESVVEARLKRLSPIPSLAEIRPYREALVVHEYEIERVVSGEIGPGTLRVAHWAVLDGQREPQAAGREGDRVTLRLEPFAEQPQLASVYLSNESGGPPGFFAVGIR